MAPKGRDGDSRTSFLRSLGNPRTSQQEAVTRGPASIAASPREGWAQGLLNRCCDISFSNFLLLRLEVDVCVLKGRHARSEGVLHHSQIWVHVLWWLLMSVSFSSSN